MRRWIVFALGFPLYVLALSYVSMAAAMIIIEPSEAFEGIIDVIVHFTPYDLVDPLDDGWMWLYFTGPALLVAVTQGLFLLPIVRRPTRGGRKSLLLSFVMVGVVAAGLATGLFLAIACGLKLLLTAGVESEFEFDGLWQWMAWIAAPLAASWIFWTCMIWSFGKRERDPRKLQRLIGLLLGGTLIEIIIVLPLDIMVRRRTDCYCSTGTAHTLGFATWAALWLAGPGIVLAALSKRRRLWSESHCASCGYAKGPSPGACCPECGYEWTTSPAKA